MSFRLSESSTLHPIVQEAIYLSPGLKAVDEICEELKNQDPEKTFQILLEKLQEPILSMIETLYGDQAPLEQRCFFHRKEHTLRVMNDTKKILMAYQNECDVANQSQLKYSDKQIDCVVFTALMHDVIQRFRIATYSGKEDDPRKIKIGIWKTNEEETKIIILELLNRVRTILESKEMNPELYISKEDIDLIIQSLMGTVPSYNPEAGVHQPNLRDEDSLLHKALPLADLGTAGTDSVQYHIDGAHLFREKNLWIDQLLVQHQSDSTRFTAEEMQQIYAALVDGQKSQVPFAQKRKERLSVELQGLDELSVKAVKRVMADETYDESLLAAELKLDLLNVYVPPLSLAEIRELPEKEKNSAVLNANRLRTLLIDSFLYPKDVIDAVLPEVTLAQVSQMV